MDLKELMTGIGVVIDDAFDGAAAGGEDEAGGADPIFQIVRQLEDEWNLPFYKASAMPPEETWPGLLQSASFILLDWRLWPSGAERLEQAGIERNRRFLDRAKDYFVPVFILPTKTWRTSRAGCPRMYTRRSHRRRASCSFATKRTY